jgi:glycosyltransferase involved in cell wall biosynthesis
MVTGALARGGAERQMIALTQGLLQNGYQVEVFELIGVVDGQWSFADEFAKLGVRTRRPDDVPGAAPDGPGDAAMAALQPFASLLLGDVARLCHALAAVIRERRPCAVNAWSDLSNLVGGFVAAEAGAPRIILGQRVLPPPFWFEPATADLYRQAYLALARQPNVVFVNNSASSIEAYERWMGLGRETIRLVHNGFSPSSMAIRPAAERAACRAAFELPGDAPVVGAVMRFAPEKDPDLWLETAALISTARPDVHFLLAGYGHDDIAGELHQKGAALGLGARLVMPGAAIDVGQVYGALDVLLLTSKSENVPNVMIEAQAAGVPVVGPAVGGVGEVMRDGMTGVLTTDRSAEALAGAVLRILDDAPWRERAAAEGPMFVAGKFDQSRMVREMMAIYEGGDTASAPASSKLTRPG